jgi:hypothetical protein
VASKYYLFYPYSHIRGLAVRHHVNMGRILKGYH